VTPAIVWLRQDLRIQDNPALSAAVARGGPVIPVYVRDDDGEGRWPAGPASRWWLHQSLASLDRSLREKGSRVVFARGGSRAVLGRLVRKTGAGAVFWSRRYEPAAIARDTETEASLTAIGIDARSFNSALLFEPQAVANRQGGPFQVFTPFWRHCLGLPVAPPVRLGAASIAAPARWPESVDLAALGLIPSASSYRGLAETWQPGEKGAAAGLGRFVANALESYASQRDRPDVKGTSMLSAHLHFGEIGPRQAWAAIGALSKDTGIFPAGNGARTFLSEIGWREFSYHMLFHFPSTPGSPLRPAFRGFPWARDPGGRMLRAWREGQTGYPIVDAGMRQLRATGWMHNRVRMIVASFLVKHLRISWEDGAEWFWKTLVDADLANNTMGWQWSAGCGADAAPYFRIFAPVRQGIRSDPGGDYVRRWVPELAGLPSELIHCPWEAPAVALAAAGVRLGDTYPGPIVDHAAARIAALEAFRIMRGVPDV
jgi:deoxyribodipyrimidine photo-lyase